MSSAGLSKPRLERLDRVLAGYVERGELPGLVALVGRGDDVHVATLGTPAFGDPAPLRRDAIFRIASITKPITTVAAMLLVERVRAMPCLLCSRRCMARLRSNRSMAWS